MFLVVLTTKGEASSGSDHNVLFLILFDPEHIQGVHATHPLLEDEQLILAKDPSVQSLLLVDHFCTANGSPVLAMERSQNKDNSREKTQYLMNTL